MKKRLHTRILSIFMSAAMFVTGVAAASLALAPVSVHAADLEVQSPGKEDIIEKYSQLSPDAGKDDTYSVAPSTSSPYAAGRLSDESLQNTLNMVNFIRFIAGMPSDVTLDDTYTDLAQHGALLTYVNGALSHQPQQPDGYPDDLYEKGYEASSSSNISFGSTTVGSILMYMSDSDFSNIEAVGHRRWILAPTIGKIGFGTVGYYSQTYVFDHSGTSSFTGYIPWPAKNMPLEYINNSDAWSVGLGSNYQVSDASDVQVTLTNKTTGKSWTFDSTSEDKNGNYLSVSLSNYGWTPTIIFRPTPGELSFSDGSQFEVSVAGIQDASGNETSIDYTVNVFSLSGSGSDSDSSNPPASNVPALQKGWYVSDGKWYYGDSNGCLHTGWLMDQGTWYWLNEDGTMATGWKSIGGTWYYLNASGAMTTGWQNVNGAWYYMDASGAMLTGWQKVGGTWYYLNNSGAMLTGWQMVDGTWYYMNGSGAMTTGWQNVGGTWYYMNGSGAMTTGWQNVGGTWYYMNGSGAMTTGWQNVGGTWYYMNGSGAMLTGWQMVDGTWYYMNDSGAMLSNCWVGQYWLTESGAMA